MLEGTELVKEIRSASELILSPAPPPSSLAYLDPILPTPTPSMNIVLFLAPPFPFPPPPIPFFRRRRRQMTRPMTRSATPSRTARLIAAIAVVRQFIEDPDSESTAIVLLESLWSSVGVAEMTATGSAVELNVEEGPMGDGVTSPEGVLTEVAKAVEMKEVSRGGVLVEVPELEEEREEADEDVVLDWVDSWMTAVAGGSVASTAMNSMLPLEAVMRMSSNLLGSRKGMQKTYILFPLPAVSSRRRRA